MVAIAREIPVAVPTERPEVRRDVYDIVKHQLYVLFSPLAAIIVYQTMVAAETANREITVGTTVLAAGLVLEPVLGRASDAVMGLFPPKTQNVVRDGPV